MARIEGLALDVHGFPTEVRTSKTFGTQTYHYHAVTKADGSMSAAYWHWTADVHMGHGDKELRKAIMAGRLVEATPRNSAGKLIPSMTLEQVLEAEQADIAALETFKAFEAAGFSR